MQANLFDQIPAHLPEEQFETLLNASSVRIERIVSQGHTTPENDWYDQNESEWILLVQGTASLLIESAAGLGDFSEVALTSGDFLLISPHQRHRVVATSTEPKAIWLAVFFS